MNLLLYFALPIATIILAVVLQKIIKCPILVAATFFAVYLILAFSAFDTSFLVYAIIYTILAYIAAYLTKFICETFGRNGILRTINAHTVNATNVNAEMLSASELINDENENNGCGCSCNRYQNNMKTYNNYRNYYRI